MYVLSSYIKCKYVFEKAAQVFLIFLFVLIISRIALSSMDDALLCCLYIWPLEFYDLLI